MDKNFITFLITKGISEEEYRGGSMEVKNDLVIAYEKHKKAGLYLILFIIVPHSKSCIISLLYHLF
jgi:hypothetical protein